MKRKILEKKWSGGGDKWGYWGYWDCQVEYIDKKGKKTVMRACLKELGIKEIEFENYLRDIIKSPKVRKEVLKKLEEVLQLKYDEGKWDEMEANAGPEL